MLSCVYSVLFGFGIDIGVQVKLMLSKPLLALLLALLLIAATALARLAVQLRDAELYAIQRELIHSEAHTIKASIDQQLTHNIGTIEALSGITQRDRGLSQEQFPALIESILPSDHTIMEVQLSTGTVITHLSVLPDRFNSLGLDLAKIPHQTDSLLQTIKERRLRVEGPFAMVGANKNIVIARDPIFIDDKFYGFAMYLIDFDRMIEKISSKHAFSIRRFDQTTVTAPFFGPPSLFEDNNSIIVDVPLTDDNWQIAVQFHPALSSILFNMLIYGFSFLFAISCWTLIVLANKFKAMSIRDPLTGAYNRRYMDESYKSNQYHFALSLDLDHFKKINDRYGHHTGDLVIVKFVTVLKNHIRPGDMVVRLGGEEFLILLENEDAAVALAIAERIRQATQSLKIREGIKITASIGICKIAQDEALKQVIQRSDALLYEAKHSGRNTVKFRP
jgi:diguanylate cyclase (GGDEF)-like protein